MNDEKFINALGVVLLALIVICIVCFVVGSLWTGIFNCRFVKAMNRMGSLRKGPDRCHGLGWRMVNRVTPNTVKLLFLLHAYVHPDERVRAFGEFAFRYIKNAPRFVIVAVISFEAAFVPIALYSLAAAVAIFVPGMRLVGLLCLVPPVAIAVAFKYTIRAIRRRKRYLPRLLRIAEELRKSSDC